MSLSGMTDQGMTDQGLGNGLSPRDPAQQLLVAQAQVDEQQQAEAQAQENTIIVVENEAGEKSVQASGHGTGEKTEVSSHNVEGAVFPPFDTTTYGPQLFWLAITFGALYLLMSKVALPRIGEILEVRRDRIEGDLAEAERLRQKTDQAIEAYETELAAARAKSHALADKTRNDVKEQLDNKRREVEAELAKQMASAEARIQKTKEQALENVEQIAAETTVALVSKLTGKISIKEARSAVSTVVKG